jgi:uncharacterized protein
MEQRRLLMALLPKTVRHAWEDRNGPSVFATANKKGIPNIVYVNSVATLCDDCFVVADNYFHKTRKNIFNGSKGALLFIDHGGKSYQVKGSLQYHTKGEVFDYMKTWNPSRHPGHAAVVLSIEEAYSGAEELLQARKKRHV